MSSLRSVFAAFAALVCGLSVWACAPRVEGGGATDARPNLTFEDRPPEWAETATSVMSELEQWRGHAFQADVRVSFPTESAPGLNGWYNSETKELVVAATESAKLGRSVLLHELFHALQDQQFDLYALRQQTSTTPDADRALSAIIEGEAMLAVSELLNYNFLAHARLPEADSVRDELFHNIFVYGDGLKFIMAIRESGGWDAVDRLFQNPPQSTASIYNPERYLAGEPELEPLDIPLNPGDRLDSQTTRGEYQVRLWLARQPETRSLLDVMNGTYLNDTLGTIETAEGDSVKRWVIAFSNEDMAQQLQEEIANAIDQASNPDSWPTSISIVGNKLVAE